MSFLNRLPFPNRNSDSGVLYIVFKRFHLTFPMAQLDFHVEARFNHSFSIMHMHRIPHLAYHTMFMCWLFTMLCASFRCLLLWVGSGKVAFVRIRSTSSVCPLHGLVLLPCGISGKMTIPSKSLLSLLASCSLFCYAYAAIPTTCLSCLPYC